MHYYSRQEMFLLVIGTANRLRNKQKSIQDSWAKENHIREINRGEIAMMEAIQKSPKDMCSTINTWLVCAWMEDTWAKHTGTKNKISKVEKYFTIFEAISLSTQKEMQEMIDNPVNELK